MHQRALREYPSQFQRDWKDSQQIQREINWMRLAYQRRSKRKPMEETTIGIIVAIACFAIAATLYLLTK